MTDPTKRRLSFRLTTVIFPSKGGPGFKSALIEVIPNETFCVAVPPCRCSGRCCWADSCRARDDGVIVLARSSPRDGDPPSIAGSCLGAVSNRHHGIGYTISFDGTAANQGIVQGAVGGTYAIPVAGVSGLDATYLTGDYGSPQTTDPAQAGKYLSTGNSGSISIGYSTDQAAFSLLWGSIDTTNALDFYEGATLVGSITGADVQALAAGFVSNGYQGPGGSAYVTVNSSTPFNKVVARSEVISFEFAGAVASTSSIDVPEPVSLTLLGTGLLGVGIIRQRGRKPA